MDHGTDFVAWVGQVVSFKSIKDLGSWVKEAAHSTTSEEKKVMDRRRNTVVEPIALDYKAVGRAANAKIFRFKERFQKYKEANITSVTREDVEREFKKTIKLTLVEVHELMNKLSLQDNNERPWIISKIQDELEECFSVLDACLRGLESQFSGGRESDANFLVFDFLVFRGKSTLPELERRFITGVVEDPELLTNVSGPS